MQTVEHENDLTVSLEELRAQIEDLQSDLQQSESQNEVLENFCFGLEQEYDKARQQLIETQEELAQRRLQKTQDELEHAFAELTALKTQQDDILACIGQGIITINPDGTVNAECSRRAREIFARLDLGGMKFVDFFADVDMQQRVQRYLETLFNSPWVAGKMVEKLNPLVDYHRDTTGGTLQAGGTLQGGLGATGQDNGNGGGNGISVANAKTGRATHQVLSFKFTRIHAAKAPGTDNAPTPVVKLLVVIDDRTREYELNQLLERRKREQEQRLELVHQILSLPPESFSQFIDEAGELLDQLEVELAELQSRGMPGVRACMSSLHRIKGLAFAVNLEFFANAAHALEDEFADLDAHAVENGRGTGHLPGRVQALRDHIADGNKLFARMLSVKGAFESKSLGHLESMRAVFGGLVEREAARAGKAVRFEYSHDLQTVPDAVVGRLKAPIIQILRNAIAHGVEVAEVRTARGKEPQGVVSLSLREEEGWLVLRCRDDGAGLDAERIKEAAIRKELVAPGRVDKLTPEECFDLIFLPGFTTTLKADAQSGRGVGLDIVRSDFEALGGVLAVKSEVHKYTEFVVRVLIQGEVANASSDR